MIPEGWSVATLKEIGTFSKGSGIKKDDVLEVGIPCIRYGQIYTEYENVIKHVRTFVSGTVAKSSRQLSAGEILFAGSGETKEEIGKCVAYIEDVGAVAGGDIVILTPKGADSCFLGFALNAHDVVVQKTERAQGDAVVHISASNLATIQVLLPPLQEQLAIAEALSDADALVESLDALIAKKRGMKQAAMQQLLTGRTRLPGFTEEWREERLGDICEIVMGQSPESRHYNRAGNGLPLIQGNADIANRRTIQRVWTTSAPKRAEAGDVLLTVRAPVGAVGRASAEVCLGRGVCAVKSNGVVSDFLFHALVAGEPRWSALEQGSTFTAANGRDVADFTVCVPEQHSEQQAIAEVLSDMDAEIDALIAKREKAELVKQGMMQELLSGRVRLA